MTRLLVKTARNLIKPKIDKKWTSPAKNLRAQIGEKKGEWKVRCSCRQVLEDGISGLIRRL